MTSPRPTLRCPCAGHHLEEALRYEAPPSGETRFDFGPTPYLRAYDRCTICSHFFSRHAIDLSRLYDRDYVDSTYGGPDGMRRKLQQILSLPADKSDNVGRVARVCEFGRQNTGHIERPRLLDVGAGLGVFPAAMKAEGWRVSAVEPDARTVRHLIDVVGIAAWAESLMDLSAERAGRFEVVSLNKVLEHVEDPVALLARAGQFLAPEGSVYIEVPDIAAAQEGSEREEFYIEHHHVFSPESFAMLISRAGLGLRRMERLREPSGKFTLIAFAAV